VLEEVWKNAYSPAVALRQALGRASSLGEPRLRQLATGGASTFQACPSLSPRPPLLEPVIGEDQERDDGRGGEEQEDAHSSVQSPRVVIALQPRPAKESGGRAMTPARQ